MKKKEALEKAIKKLKAFVEKKDVSELGKAGVIQGFEFTFELVWKYFQKLAQDQGLMANSPRSALQGAFVLGLISPDREAIWLNMLKDRNLTSHVYHQEIADLIFERITTEYLPCFCRIPDISLE